MGYPQLKQVHGVLVALLLVAVLLVYLKTRSDTLAKPKSFPDQTSLPSTNKRPYQNGFTGEQKCCDAINGKSLESACKYDGKSPGSQPIENPVPITHRYVLILPC